MTQGSFAVAAAVGGTGGRNFIIPEKVYFIICHKIFMYMTADVQGG
jgi:hypothetical protein